MTEFTFAPGEKNIIGDRFSPSVIIFWLKTSIAASSTRIQYTTPQTRSVLIQQQMLDQQRKATADDNPSMPTE